MKSLKDRVWRRMKSNRLTSNQAGYHFANFGKDRLEQVFKIFEQEYFKTNLNLNGFTRMVNDVLTIFDGKGKKVKEYRLIRSRKK